MTESEAVEHVKNNNNNLTCPLTQVILFAPLHFACPQPFFSILQSVICLLIALDDSMQLLQNFLSQSLLQSVIGLFKCALMYYACSKRLLQALNFLFIINRCEQLKIVCGQSLLQCVSGFFIMFKCEPMHYACCKHLANSYFPLYYQ